MEISTRSLNPIQDPGRLHGRVQVEGDEHPAAVGGALLHRQAGAEGGQREGRGPGRHRRLLLAQGRAHHVARREGR